MEHRALVGSNGSQLIHDTSQALMASMISAPEAGTSADPRPPPPPPLNPHAMYIPVLEHERVPSAPISGSHDLLSLFNVASVYDRFVRPYLKLPEQAPGGLANNAPLSTLPHGDVKGKGKAEAGASLGNVPSENLGSKRIKMEKSYGHYVADVGGRNSIKKDHQLHTWIMDPNFQESAVPNFMKPFSSETLGRAFTLQPGTLPGFDTSTWIAEEGGPKRKRKKRKQGDINAGNEPVAPSAQPQNQGTRPSHPLPMGNPGNFHPPPANRMDHNNVGVSVAVQPSAHATIATPHPSSGLMREEEHRKKKRTRIGAPNHQIALQL